jgi:hypothetical protein
MHEYVSDLNKQSIFVNYKINSPTASNCVKDWSKVASGRTIIRDRTGDDKLIMLQALGKVLLSYIKQ